MEQLSNDHKDNPNQHENSCKLYNEIGHIVFSLLENQGKAIGEQILESEERKKSKRARLWESQSGIQGRKLTMYGHLR